MQAAGVVFNKVDTKPFRDALRAGGFYADWKAKFGDEAWALLEKSVGRSRRVARDLDCRSSIRANAVT